jgi:hypothetical protein
MERVLKVSYGYLKFTFSAMLASTILFSLTGLAINSPRVCLVVIILGVATFFIGRDELQTRRKHAEARKRNNNIEDAAKDSIDQWAEFAQAALIIASVAAPEAPAKFTILVNEWRHQHNQSIVSDHGFSDNAQSEQATIASAHRTMTGYRDELQKAGFLHCFISKADTPMILRIYGDGLLKNGRFHVIHPFPSDSYVPTASNVVMGFMVLQEFNRNSENEIAQILKGSFELVKVDPMVATSDSITS